MNNKGSGRPLFGEFHKGETVILSLAGRALYNYKNAGRKGIVIHEPRKKTHTTVLWAGAKTPVHLANRFIVNIITGGEIDALNVSVNMFSREMKIRLSDKLQQGYGGWNDKQNLPYIRARLLSHAARIFAGEKDQCVDLGNLAMMAHYLERGK